MYAIRKILSAALLLKINIKWKRTASNLLTVKLEGHELQRIRWIPLEFHLQIKRGLEKRGCGDERRTSGAGILEQSMEARNWVGRGLSYRPARDGIFKLLRSPGIDSKESTGIDFKYPDSASLYNLAGRYDNPFLLGSQPS